MKEKVEVSPCITTLGKAKHCLEMAEKYPEFGFPNFDSQISAIKELKLDALSLFPTTLKEEKEFDLFFQTIKNSGVRNVPVLHLSNKMTKENIQLALLLFDVGSMVVHPETIPIKGFDENCGNNSSEKFFSADTLDYLSSKEVRNLVSIENSGMDLVASTHKRIWPIIRQYKWEKICLDIAHYLGVALAYRDFGNYKMLTNDELDKFNLSEEDVKSIIEEFDNIIIDYDISCTHISGLGDVNKKTFFYPPTNKNYYENHWPKYPYQFDYLKQLPNWISWPKHNALEIEVDLKNQLNDFKPYVEKIINRL